MSTNKQYDPSYDDDINEYNNFDDSRNEISQENTDQKLAQNNKKPALKEKKKLSEDLGKHKETKWYLPALLFHNFFQGNEQNENLNKQNEQKTNDNNKSNLVDLNFHQQKDSHGPNEVLNKHHKLAPNNDTKVSDVKNEDVEKTFSHEATNDTKEDKANSTSVSSALKNEQNSHNYDLLLHHLISHHESLEDNPGASNNFKVHNKIESSEKHHHDSFLHNLTSHHDSKENSATSSDSKAHNKIESLEKHNHDLFLHHLTSHRESKEFAGTTNDSKAHNKIESSEKHNHDLFLHHLTSHHDSKENSATSSDSKAHNKTESSEKHNHDSFLHHLIAHQNSKENPGTSNDSKIHCKTESSEKHNHDSFLHHLPLHHEQKVDQFKHVNSKKHNQEENHNNEMYLNHYTFDEDPDSAESSLSTHHSHIFIDRHTYKNIHLENDKSALKNPKLGELKNNSNFFSESSHKGEQFHKRRQASVDLVNESDNFYLPNLNKTTKVPSSLLNSNEKPEISRHHVNASKHSNLQSEADKKLSSSKAHTSNKLAAVFVSQLPPREYSANENPSINSNTTFLDDDGLDKNNFFSQHKNKLAAFLTSQTPASNFSEHHTTFSHSKTEHNHSYEKTDKSVMTSMCNYSIGLNVTSCSTQTKGRFFQIGVKQGHCNYRNFGSKVEKGFSSLYIKSEIPVRKEKVFLTSDENDNLHQLKVLNFIKKSESFNSDNRFFWINKQILSMLILDSNLQPTCHQHYDTKKIVTSLSSSSIANIAATASQNSQKCKVSKYIGHSDRDQDIFEFKLMLAKLNIRLKKLNKKKLIKQNKTEIHRSFEKSYKNNVYLNLNAINESLSFPYIFSVKNFFVVYYKR